MWHQLKKFITFRDRVLRVPNLAGSTQNHVPRRFWCRKYSGACGGQLAARQTNPSSFALPFERRGVGELSPVSLCSICRWHSTVGQNTARPHCGSQNYHRSRRILLGTAAWTVRHPPRYCHTADAELRGDGNPPASRAQRRGGAG